MRALHLSAIATRSTMEPFLPGLRTTLILTEFAAAFFVMRKTTLIPLAGLRSVMGKSLFALVTKRVLMLPIHALPTMFVVSELLAARFAAPVMVTLALLAPAMTRGAFVTESAEAMMMVMFALAATLVFTLGATKPVMAAMPVTGGAFVTESAEAMMMVMLALAATLVFTLGATKPVMAAMPVTGGAFVTESAEAMMMVMLALAAALVFAFRSDRTRDGRRCP